MLEVEKLSETIKELEEAVLAGGAAANAIRDYRRQIYELLVTRQSFMIKTIKNIHLDNIG